MAEKTKETLEQIKENLKMEYLMLKAYYEGQFIMLEKQIAAGRKDGTV